MKVRTLLLLSVVALVLLFSAVNWGVMTTPTQLNLIVSTWEFPIGLALLGAIGVIGILFLVFLAKIEGAALLESRNSSKELERARKIAESAEASRLRTLSDTILQEFNGLHAKLDVFLDRQERDLPAGGSNMPPEWATEQDQNTGR